MYCKSTFGVLLGRTGREAWADYQKTSIGLLKVI